MPWRWCLNGPYGTAPYRQQTLSAALAQSQRFEELIGDSPPMQQLYRELARIAASEQQQR